MWEEERRRNRKNSGVVFSRGVMKDLAVSKAGLSRREMTASRRSWDFQAGEMEAGYGKEGLAVYG